MEAQEKKTAVFKTLMFSDISCAAYQRPINYSRCKYIKEHFNPDMVGTLLVSHRTDGTYVIIDGHHRMIAMQMCGLKGHLCQVLEGLSYEDEAKLFIEFNNKRAVVSAKPMLNARMEAKEPIALDMMQAVRKAGYACGTSRGTIKGAVQISAVRAMERAYKELGKAKFQSMLIMLNKLWPQDRNAVGQAMMSGMSLFYKYYYDQIDEKILMKAMKGIEPRSLIARAKVLGDGESRTSVACEIWRHYNRVAPGDKRIRNYEF